jgi:hypothetical protein
MISHRHEAEKVEMPHLNLGYLEDFKCAVFAMQ